jgi:hypothetical protein
LGILANQRFAWDYRGRTVFNLKLSVTAAGAAFVLSLVIGVISRTGFSSALLRALISGGLFFLLSSLAYWAVSQFLPELLDLGEGEGTLAGNDPLPGSTVDISVGAAEGEDTDALPPLDRQFSEASGSGPEAGTPDQGSEAFSSGQKSANTGAKQAATLDLGGQDGYTKQESSLKADSGSSGAESSGALPGADDMVDALPDLEVLSTIFTPQEGEEPGEEAFVPVDSGGTGPPQDKKPASSGQGDFNVKEMAQAIQTILKKDEKG